MRSKTGYPLIFGGKPPLSSHSNKFWARIIAVPHIAVITASCNSIQHVWGSIFVPFFAFFAMNDGDWIEGDAGSRNTECHRPCSRRLDCQGLLAKVAFRPEPFIQVCHGFLSFWWCKRSDEGIVPSKVLARNKSYSQPFMSRCWRFRFPGYREVTSPWILRESTFSQFALGDCSNSTSRWQSRKAHSPCVVPPVIRRPFKV
jgi:hypothetical protein